MSNFKCDVCGGKVVSSSKEGWFQCENCGTEYPLEWMKSKFQKTQTVQVDGAVQVEGIANADNLYKRGCFLLENNNWEEADSYFDKVLDINIEYAPAYIGKLCAELRVTSEDILFERAEQLPKKDSIHTKNALRYADYQYRNKVENYDRVIKEYLVKTQNYQKEQAIREAESKREHKALLTKKRNEISKYKGCIATGGCLTVALKPDGTVTAVGRRSSNSCNLDYILPKISKWHDIIAVSVEYDPNPDIAGLKSDGTVVSTREMQGIDKMQDITAISTNGRKTAGLKSDGTVAIAGIRKESEDYEDYFGGYDKWQDIVSIDISSRSIAGLKSDGKIVVSGSDYHKSHAFADFGVWSGSESGIIDFSGKFGLKPDGRVVIGKSYIGGWNDIIAIDSDSALYARLVGLRSNGKVVAYNYGGQFGKDKFNHKISKLNNIVAVASGKDRIVCLKDDGTVATIEDTDVPSDDRTAPDTSGLRGIGPYSPATAGKLKKSKSWESQGLCSFCGGKFSFFSNKCKSCGKMS